MAEDWRYRSIRSGDGPIHAFLVLTEDEALAKADAIDRAVSAGTDQGHRSPACRSRWKDNLCTSGVRNDVFEPDSRRLDPAL